MPRKTVTQICILCSTQFQTRLANVKRGWGIYCSRSCKSKHLQAQRKPKPNVFCAYCRKPFYKSPSKQAKSKSGLFFCCREHKCQAQKVGGIQAIQPSHYGNGKSNYRKIAFAALPHKCNRCPYDNPLALEVHHKDGNRKNNELDNLEILCANCHTIHHKTLVGSPGFDPGTPTV